jgi:hypothetical protein
MKRILSFLLIFSVLYCNAQESGNKYIITIDKAPWVTPPPEPEPEPEPEVYYYVRPAGATYGTGDGTSYENAWSGFSAVNQLLLSAPYRTLYICGEHREFFQITRNALKIRGDYATDSGWINGQNIRSSGLNVNGRSNVTVTWLKVTHHTVQNITAGNDDGTGSYYNFRTFNCDVSNSGNQGIQHWGIEGSTASHYNLKANNCLDEGISGHQAGTINVYGGEFKNNPDGIANVIGTVIINLYEIYNTSGNGHDIKVNGGTAVGNVYNCIINNFNMAGPNTINFYDSYVLRVATTTGTDDMVGNATFTRCIVDGSGVTSSAQAIFDIPSGSSISAQYTIFIGMTGTRNALLLRSGAIVNYLTNLVFYGESTGQGIFTVINITVRNSIFRGLSKVQDSSGTITWRHCSFTNNTTGPSGTPINSVNSNPLFVNPAILDFSLQAGSPMYAAGETNTPYSLGIDTANWGSVSAHPVITTKHQPGSWTIGAVIK